MTETLRTLKMQLLLILVKVKKQINKKIVVASDKKRQQVRSNKQALSKVANSLKVMAETSLKRFKMMAEEDKKREKRYMAFRRAEAEKNWEHELRIAEIFARAAQSTSPPNFGFSHFPIGHTSTSTGFRYHKPNDKTNKSWQSWSLSVLLLV